MTKTLYGILMLAILVAGLFSIRHFAYENGYEDATIAAQSRFANSPRCAADPCACPVRPCGLFQKSPK